MIIFLLFMLFSLYANVNIFTEGNIVVETTYTKAKNELQAQLYKKAIKLYARSIFSLNSQQEMRLMAKIFPRASMYVDTYKILSETQNDDVLSLQMDVSLDDVKLKQDLKSYGIVDIYGMAKLLALRVFYRTNKSILNFNGDYSFLVPIFNSVGFNLITEITENDKLAIDTGDLHNTIAPYTLSCIIDRVCKDNVCYLYAYGTLFYNNKLVLADLVKDRKQTHLDIAGQNTILKQLLRSILEQFKIKRKKSSYVVSFRDLGYKEYRRLKKIFNNNTRFIELYNSSGKVDFLVPEGNEEKIQKKLKRLMKKYNLYIPFYIKEF